MIHDEFHINICSGNGLYLVRPHAIDITNADLLPSEPLGVQVSINFRSEYKYFLQQNTFEHVF